MSFMKWAKKLSVSSGSVVSKSDGVAGPIARRSLLWKLNGSRGSPANYGFLVMVDQSVPKETRQTLQQMAQIFNALIRDGVLKWNGTRETQLTYRPNDMQDHPVGTPTEMSVWSALDRAFARIKDLGG
jgi:hypothetical protein